MRHNTICPQFFPFRSDSKTTSRKRVLESWNESALDERDFLEEPLAIMPAYFFRFRAESSTGS